MANDVVVSARLSRDLTRTLEQTAREDTRSRSAQLEHLVKLGLADRARRMELERAAAAAADAAAAAHLAQHARLSNIPEETSRGS